MRAIQQFLEPLAGRGSVTIEDFDRPYGEPPAPVRFGVGFHASRAELLQRVGLSEPGDGTRLLTLLEAARIWCPASNMLWLEFVGLQPGEGFTGWQPVAQSATLTSKAEAQSGYRQQLHNLSMAPAGQGGGGPNDDAARVLGHIVRSLELHKTLPAVQTLDAFRRIEPGTAEDDINGPGLLVRLSRLQHPDFGKEADRDRFDRINGFLGTLFDDPEARIEVRHDHQELSVTHRARRLPLASFGTAVHQAVIVAAASTVLSRHLICVEEPEVHLHPTLQRKLLRYLRDETDNQYLIATHSAHMLDSAQASISAVRQVAGLTTVTAAITPADVADIGFELGMRASDLVQANAVVWVEGPSERIYLRHWISQIAPELQEGVHYSLLFYGGALLRHLSPEDPTVEEFIALPRVNRSFWVVIDSDRTSKDKKLNATKRRVIEGLADGGPRTGSWVTAGYTVENYVPTTRLLAAVTEVHPEAEPKWSGDRHVNPLGAAQLDGRKTGADKPAIARVVVRDWEETSDWRLDLRERVEELVLMIRQANDLRVA